MFETCYFGKFSDLGIANFRTCWKKRVPKHPEDPSYKTFKILNLGALSITTYEMGTWYFWLKELKRLNILFHFQLKEYLPPHPDSHPCISPPQQHEIHEQVHFPYVPLALSLVTMGDKIKTVNGGNDILQHTNAWDPGHSFITALFIDHQHDLLVHLLEQKQYSFRRRTTRPQGVADAGVGIAILG